MINNEGNPPKKPQRNKQVYFSHCKVKQHTKCLEHSSSTQTQKTITYFFLQNKITECVTHISRIFPSLDVLTQTQVLIN